MKTSDGSTCDNPDRKKQLTRRAFVVGSLAAGFALAVLPVSAETITTDTNGLVAGEVKIPVEGGEIPGYRAMPAVGGPFATILVVHEIFGVHEHIKDLCRRLAKLGYFAVAPALFAREGDVARMTDMQQIMKVVMTVPDRQVASDLDATVAWAKKTGHANTGKLGIVGFCWGGYQVWLYSVHNPNLRAGVAWYGLLLRRPKTALTPESPLDLAKQINVPILGLYGGADAAIPISQIDLMRSELKAASKPSEIIVYPDTPHGFNADYRPSYRPQQAKDGWTKMQAWFKDHGVI
jgi:carboxymethylenebutenolidase